ncbi:HAMP domain-containing histidine kinase [Paenibacillus sp. GSMTC-2017]|uniref:sensor histidine kinase n=1 Tax=Paenibacillus sp. GSMTC-2017 TaxID=2794350 RepID=UPI0018D5C840|nr:HAMP domain-containing sensor histidine kinase [Paenibacillus sp. GSMTC-2017]MBH5317502.1 HAMP domain-containing histidine kinase [Paenibacillus sp. GSMTC-2017]
MFKSLYTRVFITFMSAVLISVIVGFVSAVSFFLKSNNQHTVEIIENKANIIIEHYDTSKPSDLSVYLSLASKISEVGLKLTSADQNAPQYYNANEDDFACNCGYTVSIPWIIDGNTHTLEVLMKETNLSGIREIFTVLAVVLLVGGLIMLLSVRYLIKPVKEVTNAAKQIAKGDFNVRLSQHRSDELGSLSTAINEMAAELGQLDRERQDFVANVSHEFQSPLTLIKGYSSMILEGELNEHEKKQALHTMINETDRLSRLSDNLLRLAYLESDRYALSLSSFDLAEQIRKTTLAFEPMWASKQLDVSMDAERTLIKADQELLAQVWVNLMSNAIKFAPVGGNIYIKLEAGIDATGPVSVSFFDNGTPIPEKDIERIFQRFQKGDRSRDRKVGGNGLGLFLAKTIMNIHGGSITVVHERDGKSFVVGLPRNK